ncbi:HNH endonuclease [Arthrobacter sp. UYCu511]|uniref:HNH endonuclease n=1 Tax=Arthrobacter sp. UYCu511 TaxID=3156337 RepID=UPI003399CC79
MIYERTLGGRIPRGVYIDHVNRNQLDNRRNNLRRASPQQNTVNRKGGRRATSPYKGVYRLDGQHKWIASLDFAGTRIWLGTHEDERYAAYIYDQFALAIHGEFACFNVLSE